MFHVQSAGERAKEEVQGRVAVESIESFVGQEIEEMAAIPQDDLNTEVHELLVVSGKGVDDVGINKSFKIFILPNLTRKK